MFELLRPRTRAIYLSHLRSAARELACEPADLVAALLLGRDSGTDTLIQWATATACAELSPATVRGRLAAFRAVVRESRDPYQLPQVRTPRPERRRYGLDPDDVRRMILAARARLSPRTAARAEAAIRCMFECGLRVGEVAGIRLDDVRDNGATVTRKGGERTWCSWSPTLAVAIRAMGPQLSAGTLFVTSSGGPWAPRAIRAQVHALSLAALGRRVPPHALRHAGVTALLAATNGDVRRVARWANHRDVRVTLAYDDDRQDVPGQLAAELGALLALAPAAPEEVAGLL